jgi:hypothetical protein
MESMGDMRGRSAVGRMRQRLTAGAWPVALAGVLGLMAGCGEDGPKDDGNTAPLPCAITNVSTGRITSWLVGIDGPVSLRWEHQGAAALVRIDLLKGGSPVAVVAAETPNDGYYNWSPGVAGQPGGDDFGLRVTAIGEAGCVGELTGLTIHDYSGCSLTWTLDLPDNVMAGEPLLLEWSGTTTSGALNIELWQDDLGGPPEYVGTIATATPDAGQYLWDPVDSFNYGSNAWFTLKIVDAVMPDCEAYTDTFQMWDVDICTCQVLGFPAEAVFDEGQVVNLTFDQQNSSRRVRLALLTGALPVSGGLIAEDVPTNAIFAWRVDDYGYAGLVRNRFRIRIVDMADPYCTSVSDVFTIR